MASSVVEERVSFQVKALPKQIFRHYKRSNSIGEVDCVVFRSESNSKPVVEVERGGLCDTWGWRPVKSDEYEGCNWQLVSTDRLDE